jgi:hypothetical protein
MTVLEMTTNAEYVKIQYVINALVIYYFVMKTLHSVL